METGYVNMSELDESPMLGDSMHPTPGSKYSYASQHSPDGTRQRKLAISLIIIIAVILIICVIAIAVAVDSEDDTNSNNTITITTDLGSITGNALSIDTDVNTNVVIYEFVG